MRTCRLLFQLVSVMLLAAPPLTAANQRGGLPSLAARVAQLEAENADLQAALTDLAARHDADVANLQAKHDADVANLQAQVDTLANLLRNFSLVDADPALDDSLGNPEETVRITGANLQVVNGLGATDTVNGLGNIVIGYNQDIDFGSPDEDRSGSHNLVVGDEHSYTRFGGIVVGYNNEISGDWSSVSGGVSNTASAAFSSVGGGAFDKATGQESFVGGGFSNLASGFASSVSGGIHNSAIGDDSSISGGNYNEAGGQNASVSGGEQNVADGWYSSVSGGRQNQATTNYSSVTEGCDRTVMTCGGP